MSKRIWKARDATTACSRQFEEISLQGEFELVAAVVDQAVIDAMTGCIPSKDKWEKKRRLNNAEDALAWFKRKHNPIESAKPYSFEWCCNILGIHAGSIRREIVRRCAGKVAELRRRYRNGLQPKSKPDKRAAANGRV